MWLLAAAPGVEAQNGLVLALITAGSAVLVSLVTGLFLLLSARQGRQQEPPESATTILFERTAVLKTQARDSEERDETQDRRLDQIERVLDIDNPNWRHP